MMTSLLFLLDQRHGPDRLMASSDFLKFLTNFIILLIICIIVRAWLVFLCNRIIISFSYNNCHIIYYSLTTII
jgi:hypothetical protein